MLNLFKKTHYIFLFFLFLLHFSNAEEISDSSQEKNNQKTEIERITEYHHITNHYIEKDSEPRKNLKVKELQKESKNNNSLNLNQLKRAIYFFTSYTYEFSYSDNISARFGDSDVYRSQNKGSFGNNLISLGFGINLFKEIIKIEFEGIFNLNPKNVYGQTPTINLTNITDYSEFGASRFKLALVANFLASYNLFENLTLSVGAHIGGYNYKILNGDDVFIFGFGPIGDISFKANKKFDIFLRAKISFFTNQSQFSIDPVTVTQGIGAISTNNTLTNLNIVFGTMFMFSAGFRFYS